MQRRDFLSISSATVAGIGLSACQGHLNRFECGGMMDRAHLYRLRERYHTDLFDDFLPFMDRYVIDHKYGGFMCNTDRNGVNLSRDKSSWYEGRGIWVYSFLYNHLAPEERYLEIARKSVRLVMQIEPAGRDGLWPRALTREGRSKSPLAVQVYGDLFIAEGLAEFSKAGGQDDYWERAKDIVQKCVRIYDRPDYDPWIGRTYLGPHAKPFAGARVLGVWMVLLRVATQMLRMRADAELELLAARCVDAILVHHLNPEFGLLNELIEHDLSRPQNEYAQLVYTGHAIETLWMVMDEAVRRDDDELFDRAASLFRRHVEVAWDDVYGGAFRNLQHVDQNVWVVDKVLWLQEEILIGALMIVERRGCASAGALFAKVDDYVQEHFPLRKHGYSLWNLSADRKVTFEEKATRIGNYHHPRHLMLNLLALDRMLARPGARPSL